MQTLSDPIKRRAFLSRNLPALKYWGSFALVAGVLYYLFRWVEISVAL